MAWVALNFPSQRPVAFAFGAMALAFLIRELDFFFDYYIIDNLWQTLIAVAAALVIVYTYRHARQTVAVTRSRLAVCGRSDLVRVRAVGRS